MYFCKISESQSLNEQHSLKSRGTEPGGVWPADNNASGFRNFHFPLIYGLLGYIQVSSVQLELELNMVESQIRGHRWAEMKSTRDEMSKMITGSLDKRPDKRSAGVIG